MNHKTTDPTCPEKKKQANINAIRAKQNLTYAEARDMCSVFSQNQFELLNNYEDYPTLPETFAEVATENRESLKKQWERTNFPRQPVQPAVKLYKPDVKEKDKKKNTKRRHTDEESNAEKQARNSEQQSCRSEREDGVGLNNPHRVTEKEQLEKMISEAKRSTMETANRGFQEKVMKFYSLCIDQDMPEDVQDKFKTISKQCFDLAKTIL